MKSPLGSCVYPSTNYGVWVGFNDLDPFQPNSSVVLCTGSKYWFRPPRLGEIVDVVAFDTLSQSGHVVGHTAAVNYPIGARPQSVIRCGSNLFLINNIKDFIPCIDIYDENFRLIRSVPGFHHWCTTRTSSRSYCSNFRASHQLGGYGYIFTQTPKNHKVYEYPTAISYYDHNTHRHDEIISLNQAASAVSRYLKINIKHILPYSYFTHLLLAPNEEHLAFLFRFWLRDGGICTALLSIDLQTLELTIQLVGQLSHFTWLSNDELLIYANQVFNATSLRVRLNNLSSLFPLSKCAKVFVKNLNSVKHCLKPNRSQHKQSPLDESIFQVPTAPPCFLEVKKSRYSVPSMRLPLSDGHPSLDRDHFSILLSDTYPDSSHRRLLFAINTQYSFPLCKSIISEFRPETIPIYSWVNRGMKIPRFAKFPLDHLSFSRSGLHCDLHPFFNEDFTQFAYHTSEDGFRTLRCHKLLN